MSALQMGFGALIVLTGIALLYLGKGSGASRFVIFGQTVELSTPALAVIILGCAIFVMPALLPLWRPPPPLSVLPEGSGNVVAAPAATVSDPDRTTTGGNGEHDKQHQTEPANAADQRSNRLAGIYDTTMPGITARFTKFANTGGTTEIDITFRNTTGHDSDFCTRPDTWRIADETNKASCGWPLLQSGGNAICDSAGLRQLKPGEAVTAFAKFKCNLGEHDTWLFYSSDIPNPVRQLRFDLNQ